MKGPVKSLDFVGIGAGKSGTTSLFHYLRHHPKIHMPLEKEVPYFSDDAKYAHGWDQFVQEFFAKAPSDALWGKITPQYMGDLRVPERMFREMPDLKLIALLRNPVDRAFSYYRMKVRVGREQRAFEKVVEEHLGAEDLSRLRNLPVSADANLETFIVRGEYGRILGRFLDYFPRDQLLVLFTVDLEQGPQFVLDSILAFLGLEPGFSPPNLGKKYFVGGTQQRFPWLIPAVSRIPPMRWLWRTLPRSRRKAIFLRFYNEINLVSSHPPRLSPVLRQRLVEFYHPDVRELETLIEQDVPWTEFRPG